MAQIFYYYLTKTKIKLFVYIHLQVLFCLLLQKKTESYINDWYRCKTNINLSSRLNDEVVLIVSHNSHWLKSVTNTSLYMKSIQYLICFECLFLLCHYTVISPRNECKLPKMKQYRNRRLYSHLTFKISLDDVYVLNGMYIY